MSVRATRRPTKTRALRARCPGRPRRHRRSGAPGRYAAQSQAYAAAQTAGSTPAPERRARHRRQSGRGSQQQSAAPVDSSEASSPTTGARDADRPAAPVGRGCPSTHRRRKRPVMRTHDAGTLRAEHAGIPSRSPAGSPAGAITAGWPSWICATPPDSCRWSCGTRCSPPRGLTTCATSTACNHRRGLAAPGGNANPDLPTGDVEVVASRLEVLNPPPRCRSRSTSGSTSARRPGSSTATSTCADPAPRRHPAAQRGQPGRPRGAGRTRLRRDRDADTDPLDPRGRAGLPGAGPAQARVAGTRCRRARSCSSSC